MGEVMKGAMITMLLLTFSEVVATRGAGGQFPGGTPFSINFTSVDRKLTVLSWRLSSGKNDTWVHHAMPKAVYRRPDIKITAASAPCAVEVMGIMIDGYGKEMSKNSSYELRYAMIFPTSSESAGKSYCSLYHEYLASSVERRQGKRIDSREDVVMLHFFCPIFEKASCSKLRSFQHNMNLTMGEFKSTFSFKTNSLNSRKLKPSGVAVCAFDVNSNLELSGEKMKAFVSHYNSLGFERVVVYSPDFTHNNLSNVLNTNLLSWHMPIDTLTEVMKTSMHFQTDLFLDVALSFCRFELSMFVRDVLVVSTEEFLYCPAAAPTHLEQRKALSKLLSSNFQTMAFDSVILPFIKDVPQNVESYYSRFASQEFECKKDYEFDRTLHRGLLCPHTTKYSSCTSNGRPIDIKCWCTMNIQRTCEIFQLPTKPVCAAAERAVIRSYDMHLKQFRMYLNAQGNNSIAPADERNYKLANSLSVLSKLSAFIDDSHRALKNMTSYYQGFSSKLHTINLQSAAGKNLHYSIKGVPPLCYIGEIRVFYILTPRTSGRNVSTREGNVYRAISNDPQTHYFSALFHTPWTTIKNLFKDLKIPTSHIIEPFYGKSKNRRGKYARWASLILAVSYAVQNRLGHVILLEDDTVWPSDLRQQVVPYLREDDTIVKLSQWGEGYLFSLPAAIRYLFSIYELGISRHSDTFIIHRLPHIRVFDIPYTLLVEPSMGNIMDTIQVNNKIDFPYKPSKGDPSPLFSLLGIQCEYRKQIYHCNDTRETAQDLNNSYRLFEAPTIMSSSSYVNLTHVAMKLNHRAQSTQ